MARVLIIDDDPDIIDSLTLILEAKGHRVAVKTDTAQLIEEVVQINPDIIILDVIFPEDPQAGFKAARSLRQSERIRHIPILMLSAVNQRSNLAFNFSNHDISDDFLPVDAFLDKPVEPQTLLRKLDELLKDRGWR